MLYGITNLPIKEIRQSGYQGAGYQWIRTPGRRFSIYNFGFTILDGNHE
jgi:hypothetical protein